MFVQEAKCFEHILLEIGRKSWRNYEGVGIDVTGEVRGLGIMWDPDKITLVGCVSSQWSFYAEFHIVGMSIRGVFKNVYGPHTMA